MSLTNEEKEAMRVATHEAAVAFLDDLNFMCRTLALPKPTAGDVRRLSVIIRRCLLDGQLQAVAAPRIGRIKLVVPDFEHWVTDVTFDFLTVGLPPLFGWKHGLFEFYRIDKIGVVKDDNSNFQLAPALPFPVRLVNIEGLLSNRVVRLCGTLISRLDFLKFVCYQDFGVHYSGREEAVFELIRRIRYFLSFFVTDDDILGVAVGDNYKATKPPKMLLDLAHAHTLATGYYMAISPDVARLAELIEAEVASAEGATDNGED